MNVAKDDKCDSKHRPAINRFLELSSLALRESRVFELTTLLFLDSDSRTPYGFHYSPLSPIKLAEHYYKSKQIKVDKTSLHLYHTFTRYLGLWLRSSVIFVYYS